MDARNLRSAAVALITFANRRLEALPRYCAVERSAAASVGAEIEQKETLRRSRLTRSRLTRIAAA